MDIAKYMQKTRRILVRLSRSMATSNVE